MFANFASFSSRVRRRCQADLACTQIECVDLDLQQISTDCHFGVCDLLPRNSVEVRLRVQFRVVCAKVGSSSNFDSNYRFKFNSLLKIFLSQQGNCSVYGLRSKSCRFHKYSGNIFYQGQGEGKFTIWVRLVCILGQFTSINYRVCRSTLLWARMECW